MKDWQYKHIVNNNLLFKQLFSTDNCSLKIVYTWKVSRFLYNIVVTQTDTILKENLFPQ